MTGGTPYASARTDSLVIRAIGRGDLPMSIDHDAIPQYGKGVLRKCWSQEPTRRPLMKWCLETLYGDRTSKFEKFCTIGFASVPGEYRRLGNGWHAILNPESDSQKFLWEFLSPNRSLASSLVSLSVPQPV